MAQQTRKAWENPIQKQHVVGAAIGVVATAIFCFGYPGWFMSRSSAEQLRTAEADKVRADYCLASYLASGVTPAEAAKVRTKGTREQSDILVNAGHAPDTDAGSACGRALDKLSTEAQIDAAIKVATAAATARAERLAGAKQPATTKN